MDTEKLKSEIARIKARITEGEQLLVKYPDSPELKAGQLADESLLACMEKMLTKPIR